MRFLQHEKYPRCAAYLTDYLSLLEFMEPKVYKAFKAVCEADIKADLALLAFVNPLVHIGGVPCKANGMYKGMAGGPKHTVFINTLVAEQYEYDYEWKTWESTVLHEIVHYVRYLAGNDVLYQGQEAGKAFEIQAYGADIQCGCYSKCKLG